MISRKCTTFFEEIYHAGVLKGLIIMEEMLITLVPINILVQSVFEAKTNIIIACAARDDTLLKGEHWMRKHTADSEFKKI